MKTEVGKPDINKLVNIPTSFNIFETKVDDLDGGKLKTVPVHLKKLSDVVDNEVSTKDKRKQFRKENSWCKYFNSHKSIQHR